MTKFDKRNHRILFNIDANVWMYKYRRQSALYRPSGKRLTAKDIHRYVNIIADGIEGRQYWQAGGDMIHSWS